MVRRARRARGGGGGVNIRELQRFGTDADLPLAQGPYRSPLRDEQLAAWLGASLGVLFSICFLTGLYSHLHQHPLSWLPVPARPAGLYRITQGVHVAAGIASMPVLVAKLWVVWPRFLSFPPVKRLSHLVERIGLFPLVAGGIFMVFSGDRQHRPVVPVALLASPPPTTGWRGSRWAPSSPTSAPSGRSPAGPCAVAPAAALAAGRPPLASPSTHGGLSRRGFLVAVACRRRCAHRDHRRPDDRAAAPAGTARASRPRRSAPRAGRSTAAPPTPA